MVSVYSYNNRNNIRSDFKCEFVFYQGLRTLCIGMSDISPSFYDDWKHTYYKASTSIQNREKKLEEAAELIETVSEICLTRQETTC